jgi:hypothetical protein
MAQDINEVLGISGPHSDKASSSSQQSGHRRKNLWDMFPRERYPNLWSSGSTLRTCGVVLKVLGCITFVLALLRFLVLLSRWEKTFGSTFGGDDWIVLGLALAGILSALVTYIMGVFVAGAGEAAHAMADIGLSTERSAEAVRPAVTGSNSAQQNEGV